MLQESPKLKGISKNRKGKPRIKIPKNTVSQTKTHAKNEIGQTLSKYKKTAYYNPYKVR